MQWFFIIFPAMLAGLVQGLTGFGTGIVLMIFLPAILPMSTSAGVAALIPMVSIAIMVHRYHDALHFKRLIWPFLVYASVATWSIHLGKVLDVTFLKLMLGCLLCVLSLYFLFVKSAANRHYPLVVAVIFTIISGFFNGLFGIGGPLMALYFLSLAESKETYMASIQTFFLIDMTYVTGVRLVNGIFTPQDLPIILVGILGAVIGTIIANHLLTRLNLDVIRQIIYVFIGCSGVFYLVTSLQSI